MSTGDIVPIIQEEMITVNKACHTNSNLKVTRSIQEAPHFLSPMVSVQKPPLVHNFFYWFLNISYLFLSIAFIDSKLLITHCSVLSSQHLEDVLA